MNKLILTMALASAVSLSGMAHQPECGKCEVNDTIKKTEKKSRLTLGGYGEATYTYNFFSDNPFRYSHAANYKDASGHGRFDLPHVVIALGYDFGKGWSVYSEIEFEHGGTESAVEMEAEETGEYEQEVERGGEIVLEQFWVQKSFMPELNLRMGHQIVPVGLTNVNHLPTEFFTVFRPEGESTILPCTWHETGVELWGRIGDWRYEAMLLAGLDSDRFGNQNWVASGAGSPYEFKIGNAVAGAFRIDNYSVKGLRMGLSGYVGNSFCNSLQPSTAEKYKSVKGTVSILAFDAEYNDHNLIARGSFDWGHLSNSAEITAYNKSLPAASPSPRTPVASDALSAMVSVGYDFFSFNSKLHKSGQKLYLFGQYEYYDSMWKTADKVVKSEWSQKNRFAVGLNYYPIRDIVIKAEYSYRDLKAGFNDEPSFSIGVAYAGFFL